MMKIVNVFVPAVLILWSAIMQVEVQSAASENNTYLMIGQPGYFRSIIRSENCMPPQGSYVCFQNERVKITCFYKNSTFTRPARMSGLELVFNDGETSVKVFTTNEGSPLDPIFMYEAEKRFTTKSGKRWLDFVDTRGFEDEISTVIHDKVSKSTITVRAALASSCNEFQYLLTV